MDKSITHYRTLTLMQEGVVTAEQVNGMIVDPYTFEVWINNFWRKRAIRFNDQTAHRHKMQDEKYADIRKTIINRYEGRIQELKDKFNAVTPDQVEKVMKELKVPAPIKTAKQIRDEKNR